MVSMPGNNCIPSTIWLNPHTFKNNGTLFRLTDYSTGCILKMMKTWQECWQSRKRRLEHGYTLCRHGLLVHSWKITHFASSSDFVWALTYVFLTHVYAAPG